MDEVRELLLVGQAAREAGVSEQTMRRWVDAGLVKAARLHHVRVVDQRDLRRFLRDRSEARA
ncbi:helix-turn-helix domain-containing protein [Deinococcus yavapaiensis]|uniref:Helix-turn-helix protein n=1 Tax=Deinococcus yavapaiensis KR-236 TaxID=694435 RepID=A0A318S8W6_9DEIO|nr:helix-turn-helix domain-containing protein [Deinococcus yavapaiensis]PYE55486.1 helix-turn-helix protein [Deinococcus yavapaiensis KR-236]